MEENNSQIASSQVNPQIDQGKDVAISQQQPFEIGEKNKKLFKILAYVLASIFLVVTAAFGFWAYQKKMPGERRKLEEALVKKEFLIKEEQVLPCSKFQTDYALVYYKEPEKERALSKVDLCSGEEVTLHKEDFQIASANPSPDRTKIAYIINKGSSQRPQNEIVVIDLENNSFKYIPLEFSVPGNSKIVWKSNEEVSLLGWEFDEEASSFPSWKLSWEFDLYILNIKNGLADKIFHLDKNKYPPIIQQLAWDQAGSSLFFTAENRPDYSSYNHKGSISGKGIYKISFNENNKIEQLVFDFITEYNFSPSQEKIAYTTDSEEEGELIKILDIKTLKEEFSKRYYDIHREAFWTPGLVWSPDKSKVVFTWLSKRQTEKRPPFFSNLEVLDVNKQKTDILIEDLPAHSPEPIAWVDQEIYFVSRDDDENPSLFKYSLDTKDKVRIATFDKFNFPITPGVIGLVRK